MSDEDKILAVLKVLNDARRNARSENMMQLTSAEVYVKIRRIAGCEAITKNDVLVALDYMSGNQIQKITSKHRIGYTPGAKAIAKRNGMSTNPSVTVVRFKITQKGIVMLEGKNDFTKVAEVRKITVNANNSQVVIGSQNIIKGNIIVIDKLTELQQKISESNELDLEQKQDIVADIDSIKAQLSKPNPAIKVIKALWAPIAAAADIAGASQLAAAVATALAL